MKKVLLLTSAICLALGAQAQMTETSTGSGVHVHIAPEIGLNIANMHGTMPDGAEVNYKGAKLGVKAGVNADIMIGNNFSIQPGLFYSIKGGKRDANFGPILGHWEDNYTLHYFEVPLNFQYYFNDPGEGRFFIGVGGYVGVPFSGKNKYHRSIEGQPDMDGTTDLHFGSNANDNDLERFDFGVSANAGYYLRSGIFFRAMVQRGLANNIPDGQSTDQTLKLNTYSVSIGYMIGGKR